MLVSSPFFSFYIDNKNDNYRNFCCSWADDVLIYRKIVSFWRNMIVKKSFLKNIIVILSLCALIAGSLSLSGCAYLFYEEYESGEQEKPLATLNPTAVYTDTATPTPDEDVTESPVQNPTE